MNSSLPFSFKASAETFEIMKVRFEDRGKITCHAENVFGIRVVHVKLIVFGEFVSISVSLYKLLDCLYKIRNFFKMLEEFYTDDMA